jgi:GWxTD domain-containing protein
MKKFVAVSYFVLTSAFGSEAVFAQASVQMDAIAFARDSGKTQVEMYYTVPQGAMPFEQKTDGRLITINARAELWENGRAIAARPIKKEKFVKGSKAIYDSTRADLIIDGVALTGDIKNSGEAAIIFFFKNDKGTETADTIKRTFVPPATSKGNYAMGGIELAISLTPASDHSNPFEKAGFIITPNPSKLYGVGNTKLAYYSEAYIPPSPVSPGSECEVTTRVLDGTKHLMFSNTHRQTLMAPVTPVIGTIDIDGLPSDSYTLQIEVKSGDVFRSLSEKQFYFDDGMKVAEEPSANPQALDEETIYTTSGIASMAEMEVLEKGNQAMYIAKADQQKAWKKLKERSEAAAENSPEKEKIVTEERKFLYSFWRMKDAEKGSRIPLTAFHDYYQQVEETNKKFTNQKTPGWETDFGRIFLKYGAPDERNIDKQLHTINAKPYISWTYYDKNIQLFAGSHPVFVFVDRRGGGKFELVHSNVLGETYEQDWYSREVQIR